MSIFPWAPTLSFHFQSINKLSVIVYIFLSLNVCFYSLHLVYHHHGSVCFSFFSLSNTIVSHFHFIDKIYNSFWIRFCHSLYSARLHCKFLNFRFVVFEPALFHFRFNFHFSVHLLQSISFFTTYILMIFHLHFSFVFCCRCCCCCCLRAHNTLPYRCAGKTFQRTMNILKEN